MSYTNEFLQGSIAYLTVGWQNILLSLYAMISLTLHICKPFVYTGMPPKSELCHVHCKPCHSMSSPHSEPRGHPASAGADPCCRAGTSRSASTACRTRHHSWSSPTTWHAARSWCFWISDLNTLWQPSWIAWYLIFVVFVFSHVYVTVSFTDIKGPELIELSHCSCCYETEYILRNRRTVETLSERGCEILPSRRD